MSLRLLPLVIATSLAAVDMPYPIAWSDCQTRGMLRQRLERNFDRLEQEKYQPDKVFLTNEQSHWWPGDTEGRTVLGLVLDAQATGRTPRFLDAILARFPEKLNAQGYFGDIHPAGTADEQQLSSHGWVLRGLCEHHLWKRDAASLAHIRRMVDALALPLAGHYYPAYPIRPEDRIHGGGAIGERKSVVIGGRTYLLSTDIGCAFIFMDGVIQAQAVDPRPALEPLIGEMTTRFLAMDLVAIKAQTHATLTGLRGLLRRYGQTGDRTLVDETAKRFDLYRTTAMTETYENWNWFGRPTHTEPCAIVDSFQVAVGLWQATGATRWLEDAHHIAFNAIASTQQANGGFGLHDCPGANGSPWLTVTCPEAHWCCTMRGGEGLARIARSAWFLGGDAAILVMPGDNRAVLRVGGGTLAFDQQSGYPLSGGSRLTVAATTATAPVALRLFAPSFTADHRLAINGQTVAAAVVDGFITVTRTWTAGDVVEWGFTLRSRWCDPVNRSTPAGWRTLRHGPLILAVAGDGSVTTALPADAPERLVRRDDGSFTCGDAQLIPVHHLMEPRWSAPADKKTGPRRQVLFR